MRTREWQLLREHILLGRIIIRAFDETIVLAPLADLNSHHNGDITQSLPFF